MDAEQTITLPTERMIARIEGSIGWMIFNNPERRNAVSAEMNQAVPLIMDRFEADPNVRAIVLRGAGEKAFVAGADISQFEKNRATPEQIAKYDKIGEVASKRLAETNKPTIAMINGWCVGGGVGIAITCDLRICSENSKFGIPAARLGLGYGAPGVKKLMDLVGPAHVKEIFFTARHFAAAEALGMGLVNRVVPEAELESYVRNYCALIAMINGWCVGGGVGIAITCDLRICSENSKFGIPAARLGLGYGAPGVKKLMDLVGPAHVKEIFFTARHFTAAEALGMGLVNRVVPEAELESYVRNYCALIADNAPLTMRALKRSVNELRKPSSDIDWAKCERWVKECFDSQDYIEGRRAFMEKRKPVFAGR